MDKAILVTDFQDIQALNKLFESGYKVQSADNNGVYILEHDELEAEPIKDVERTTKQPHVRIEFDDIRDVPKVWVDGELIAGVDDKPLISLMVDWKTDTENQNHKGFDINYFDKTDKRGQSKGFHQATVI
ncbi:hypothetical protein EFL87_11285 [Weissella confusa]|uniref:hypothetical protein n=1 Tax=Weissella confusa TaxID=1583 RepID=UPI00223A6CB9|nr:hypothetical protein [Weissella confusa]MCT0042990.1 hypothetical protein [Weissella confusa]